MLFILYSVYKSTPDSHEVSGCVDGSKVLVVKENFPDTGKWLCVAKTLRKVIVTELSN